VARVKLAGQVLAVAAVAGLLALLVWKITHQGGGPRDFTLSRLGAPGQVTLSKLKGKVVVLNFWASWCQPCKGEAPRLEQAWRRFRSQGVVVLGVDAQDFSTDARRFARRYKLTYPLVHDGPGNTLSRFGVDGFPETLFVDRAGKFVGDHVKGEISADQLTRNIEVALSS